MIYETDTDYMYVWSGTAWVLLPPTASPTFTGVPAAPTATTGTNTTQLATTAFANAAGGLVYVTSATVGTGVSSHVTANCFSATYDSYEILYNAGVSSVTEVLYATLSGNTGSNYYSAGAQNTSGSGTYNGIGAAGAVRFQVATCTTTSFGLTMTVHNPFLAKQTYGRCNFASDYTSGWTGHVNNNPISSTGFTFLPGSGTLTGGTVTVYGYRKA